MVATNPGGIELHGDVEAGFGPVADAFARCFTEHGDVGAAVAVYHQGRPVVDLWAGHADGTRARRWERDTVVMTFSTTKGVTAVCANLLIQRGLLDPDAPIARYWPAFAANGKEQVTVGMALSHQAGLAALDAPVSIDDVLGWDGVVAAVAEQAPLWEPGTAHGYHARTYGWIVGELIRRVTGKSPGRFLADEIAGPLGLRFWIGLPAEHEADCADLITEESGSLLATLPADSMLRRALTGPSDLFAHGYDDAWNQRPLRAVELPSSNGIGDARSLARLYAACLGEVDGKRLLDPHTVARATAVRASGVDLVVGMAMTYGLGFFVGEGLLGAGRPHAFGHSGAGGSGTLADPDSGLSLAYVMNRLRFDDDPRAGSLAAAALACV